MGRACWVLVEEPELASKVLVVVLARTELKLSVAAAVAKVYVRLAAPRVTASLRSVAVIPVLAVFTVLVAPMMGSAYSDSARITAPELVSGFAGRVEMRVGRTVGVWKASRTSRAASGFMGRLRVPVPAMEFLVTQYRGRVVLGVILKARSLTKA
jgi:hypothetical protein